MKTILPVLLLFRGLRRPISNPGLRARWPVFVSAESAKVFSTGVASESAVKIFPRFVAGGFEFGAVATTVWRWLQMRLRCGRRCCFCCFDGCHFRCLSRTWLSCAYRTTARSGRRLLRTRWPIMMSTVSTVLQPTRHASQTAVFIRS